MFLSIANDSRVLAEVDGKAGSCARSTTLSHSFKSVGRKIGMVTGIEFVERLKSKYSLGQYGVRI